MGGVIRREPSNVAEHRHLALEDQLRDRGTNEYGRNLSALEIVLFNVQLSRPNRSLQIRRYSNKRTRSRNSVDNTGSLHILKDTVAEVESLGVNAAGKTKGECGCCGLIIGRRRSKLTSMSELAP